MAPIPGSVRFPFGYKVEIRLVTGKQIKRINGHDAHGCWDGGTRKIYIDKTLEAMEQRYVLSHEMIHAFADWQHFVLGGEGSNPAVAVAR